MCVVSLPTRETKPHFCGASAQFGGVATHGLRAVCGASAQFVMVSNHGISVPFVIHVLVSFMLPFVIGLPPLFCDFWIS